MSLLLIKKNIILNKMKYFLVDKEITDVIVFLINKRVFSLLFLIEYDSINIATAESQCCQFVSLYSLFL